jgi:hypothetical protein
MAIGQQPLADPVNVDMGDLAAEEVDAEARHRGDATALAETGRRPRRAVARPLGLRRPLQSWQ